MPQCKVCSRNAYSEYCFRHKPRKPLKKTHIKRIGKRTKVWIDERKSWISDNPPDYRGYWYCHYCRFILTIETLTLDHMYGRDGNLLTDRRYIVPCCSFDNNRKGSRSYESYCKEFYPHLIKK